MHGWRVTVCWLGNKGHGLMGVQEVLCGEQRARARWHRLGAMGRKGGGGRAAIVAEGLMLAGVGARGEGGNALGVTG